MFISDICWIYIYTYIVFLWNTKFRLFDFDVLPRKSITAVKWPWLVSYLTFCSHCKFLFSINWLFQSEKYLRLRQCQVAECYRDQRGQWDQVNSCGGLRASNLHLWDSRCCWRWCRWSGVHSSVQIPAEPSAERQWTERTSKFDSLRVTESVVGCDWMKRIMR